MIAPGLGRVLLRPLKRIPRKQAVFISEVVEYWE